MPSFLVTRHLCLSTESHRSRPFIIGPGIDPLSTENSLSPSSGTSGPHSPLNPPQLGEMDIESVITPISRPAIDVTLVLTYTLLLELELEPKD